MNWHDTIISIQKSDIYKDLVLDTFISSDLNLNIKRYSESQEFKEIKKIISKIYSGRKIKILDVGAGNGISSIALAKEGHYITALEPDNSDLVGSQAIRFGANINKVKIEIIAIITDLVTAAKDTAIVTSAADKGAYKRSTIFPCIFEIIKEEDE